ncbi:MAG TPA: tetratricopeptide repeat protein [Bryobacteraceae bacterium]|nr:tetratricopeptide repeat protein [Bryobacteraceae bacterium]
MTAAPTLLLLLALWQAPPPAAEDPLQMAAGHLDAGRYGEAVKVLTGFVEKNPDSVAGHFNLALSQSLAGNDEAAIDGFRKVLALQPGLFEAQVNLGQALVQAGRFEEAKEPLQAAAGVKADEPRVVYLQARALLGLKQLREGAALLARVVELEPANQDRRLELAETYERAGMRAEARAAWEKVVEVPAARERLALLLMDAGELEAAIGHLEVVMKQQPTPGGAFALATAYLRNQQPEKGIPLAQAIVQHEPDNPGARLFLGRLLRDQKQYGPAAQQFQAATRLTPDSLEAWNEFAAALVLLQQHEPALQALERVRTLGGETAAYHYLRATLLDARKEHKPALESYQKFLAMSEGKHPDEEFKARQRVRLLERMTRR